MHEHLRFPVGKFSMPAHINSEMMEEFTATIAQFPAQLAALAGSMTDAQLDTPYRPDGWTARQVIHHCADSHMNAFIRLKLALTEDAPTIKPYYEERWALTPDALNLAVAPSLRLLDGLHQRWATLLRSLAPDDLARTFVHPEHGRVFRLDGVTALYAWHCRHHLGHVQLVAGVAL